MATISKDENTSDEQHSLTNFRESDDSHEQDDHCHDDYVHNPEEFIDIHASDRHPKTHGTDRDSSQCLISSTAEDEASLRSDLTLPSKNENRDVFHSSSRLDPIQNLKVPVQVSEECDTRDLSCDLRGKTCSDSDGEEYQSADEGDRNEDRIVKEGLMNSGSAADDDDDEDDSEDDFIPVGDEDEGACGDHRGVFSNQEEFCMPKEDSHKEWEEEDKEEEIIDDMEVRRKQEEMLTEEERQERKSESQQLKDEGNSKFRNGDFDEAISAYNKALEMCPLNFHKERSIMFSNRAACLMKKELFEEAIKDSSSALDLHPHYMKALLRRAELYEKTEKLDEALKDYQKAVELDPSQHMARAACMRLAEQIKERNEKMKEEMIGKLKDLGNLVLRPFGLSVNNFNLQQDPNTGSYSVQFQQNPPRNGS